MWTRENSRKGQISSVDALVASVVFALLLAFMVFFWFLNLENVEKIEERSRLETSALMITDMLLKGDGYPENWENDPSSAETLGLAVSDYDHNMISRTKLENFTSMDYNQTKELLGLDETVDYSFVVEDFGSNRLYVSGDQDVSENKVVSIVRFAVLSEAGRLVQPVRMRLMLYEAK